MNAAGIACYPSKGREYDLLKIIQDCVLSNIVDILEMRFDVVPKSILNELNEIDDHMILKSLLKKAVTVKSLDEFRETIFLVLQ